MIALNLEEFAEGLRTWGDWREVEFATEILDLLNIEKEVAEPYSNLCDDLEHYAKDFSNPTDAAKALEWVGDRSNLLKEIEEELDKDGRLGDVIGANGKVIHREADDAVKSLLETLAEIRDAVGLSDEANDEELLTKVQALVNAAPALEYDL